MHTTQHAALTHVTVFGDAYYNGFNGEEEGPGGLTFGRSVPLADALQHNWATDAHAALYSIPGESGLPRLNKPAMAWFLMHPGVGFPQLNAVMIDVDLPDHGERFAWHNTDRWPAGHVAWYQQVNRAMQQIPELGHAGVYLTRGGMRFVWPLAHGRQIGVDLASSYLRQFHRYLLMAGLPVDESCAQWNRLFRLPYVVRDGRQLRLQADFTNMRPLDWAPPYALEDEGPNAVGRAARVVRPDDIPLPRASELNKLRGTKFYPALAAGAPIAEEGQRHHAVMHAAAVIVSKLETTDPLQPYRLLLKSTRAADFPDDELWAQCVWVCQLHDGAEKMRQEQRRAALSTASEQMMVPEDRAREQLILATRTSSNFYVWNEAKNTWDSPIVGTTLLLSKMRRGCPSLFHMSSDTPDKQILETYATTVNHVVVSYVRSAVEFDQTMGIVYEPGAPIDPRLVPEFDPVIDQWLRLLFASELDRCFDWLATITRLDRPTCALYIKAEPDVGKGLLAQSIARIWNTAPSKYEELIRNFQDGLSQCPLIWADESIPQDQNRQNDSSIFRSIIGTGRQKIFRKMKPPADLEGFPRVLITANNPDALNIRDSLEPADIRAIEQRVGYVETGTEAGDFLKAEAHRRGMSVMDMVQPWIDGKVAAHLLHLRDTRTVVHGDRFLVDGWPSTLTARMAVRFGAAPLVGRFIATVIRDRMRRVRGVLWGNGEVYANADYIRDSWRHVMGATSRVPGDQTIMKALKALSDGEAISLSAAQNETPRYFWRISVFRLLQLSEDFHLTDQNSMQQAINEPHTFHTGNNPGPSNVLSLPGVK